MARKLSRVARCVLNIATASALSSAAAFGQIGVDATPASRPVINPFAAKRATTQQVEAPPAASIVPIESPGPKAFQNPFARREKSPRFIVPRLQPGPLSRWHRADQASAHPSDERPNDERPSDQRASDERPIQALAADPVIASAKGDLSGPLAHEERRTALFALPGANEPVDWANPPDPSKFGRKELRQPAWLLPHETQVTTASAEATESYAQERAVALPPSDPFDEDVAEIVVSDDAPIAEKAPPQKLESIIEQHPLPTQHEEVVGPELKLPATKEIAVVQAKIPQPAIKQLPTPPKRGAEDWYADAEKAAAKANSTNDLAAVVELCQRGIECRPDPELGASLRGLAAWACNRSGEIESDQRREDEALKAFELAIQWDPNCWLALHNRAVSRAQQGDLPGALADFNRCLHLNPGLAVAFRNRGELLAATGRTEEAIADYTMALAQLPQDAELLTMRGEGFHRLGEYEKALADLTQAIELAPHNAIALAQRGNVQAELGGFERAIADFQQALAADASSAEAHRSFAWLLATCPDPRFRNERQALAAAEAAAKLSAPGDPFVLDALAAANANAGQFDRAVRIQQEAIVNVPQDFAAPFQQRLAMYAERQPFRNGTAELVDENVRAASLETDPATQR